MNDYSLKFKNSQSYITNINIDKGNNKINVTFKNGEVFTYPLTKENILLFYDRLREQYILAGANANDMVKNSSSLVFLVLTVITGLLIPLSISTSQTILVNLILLGLFVVECGIILYNGSVKKREKEKLEIACDFLVNSSKLSESIQNEKNILDTLSKSDQSVIEKEKKKLDEYDIDVLENNVGWIDQISLSSLKRIQNRLIIYQGLKEKVELKKGMSKAKKKIKEKK